jgi:integrase
MVGGNIEQFERAHPIGSRARLALALLLCTGQRRGDVVRMGDQHIHDGILTIDQKKGEGTEEAYLEIPVHPKLREIIGASPTGHLSFLTTIRGKPDTPRGFSNWFRKRCNEAGLPKDTRRMDYGKRVLVASQNSDAPEHILGSRLIKSTIQERRRGRQRPGNFAPACRSGLRCA